MATDFDLTKTQVLFELASLPRDDTFAARFLEAVPHASLTAPAPQVMNGPDGFPYFRLALPKAAEPFDAFSIAHVAPFCARDGLGAVVLANLDGASSPLWVFSYGDLWSWHQFGGFDGDPADPKQAGEMGSEIVKEARPVLVGSPSEEFFPAYARAVIGRYFVSAGMPRPPAVKLVIDAARGRRDLMLNYGVDDFPDEARMNAIMRRLPWFLPRRRAMMLRVDALTDGEWTPLG